MKKYIFTDGTIIISKMSGDEKRLAEKKHGKLIRVENLPKSGYLWQRTATIGSKQGSLQKKLKNL